MLIFVHFKVALPNCINSVQWRLPFTINERNWSRKSSGWTKWKWLNWVDKLYSLMVRSWCPRSFVVRDRCDHLHSWYTELMWFGMRLVWFRTVYSFGRLPYMFVFLHSKSTKVTLRDWCNSINSPYGVKNQHKVTLKKLLSGVYSFLLILWWRPFKMLYKN
jgi:hypothetical protein